MIWLKSRIAAILAAVGGVLAVLGAMYAKGRKDATQARENEAARDYIKERQRQDEMDVGAGATDDERIRMLKAIRDRNGTGKD